MLVCVCVCLGAEHQKKLKLEEQEKAAEEKLKYKKRQIKELQEDIQVIMKNKQIGRIRPYMRPFVVTPCPKWIILNICVIFWYQEDNELKEFGKPWSLSKRECQFFIIHEK